MKKLLPLLTGILWILTGCGSATESITSPQPEENPIEAQTETQEASAEEEETTEAAEETTAETEEETTAAPPEETTEPQVEAESTETVPETEEETSPPSDKPAREDVIAAYKMAIQARFDIASSYDSSNSAVVEYALYDMDYDGIPELLVKYGTCEADFSAAIYTYRNDSLKLIADNVMGGHSFFGYDYVANQIVLCWGHMGYGNMEWYDLDENGELRFLIETHEFEFAGPNPSYTYYMEKYNVGYLDSSEFFGNDTTWIFRYSGYDSQTEEYGGFDYHYLENYPF